MTLSAQLLGLNDSDSILPDVLVIRILYRHHRLNHFIHSVRISFSPSPSSRLESPRPR